MFKEISYKEIDEYKDVFSLFSEDGIAYADDGQEGDGLTIGWGSLGILWSKPVVSVYIHKTRYSKVIFDKADSFSVMFFDEGFADKIKYFGTVSGRDEDKVEGAGFTLIEGDIAPYFKEAKLAILAKKIGQSDFDPAHVDNRVKDWYAKSGVHTIYYGHIQKVLVRED